MHHPSNSASRSLPSATSAPVLAPALVLAITCILGPVHTASAQPPMRGPMTFDAFDQNGDGAITEQEFYDARAQRIRERAQQGYPMRNAPNAPSFESVDSDGNGLVSPDELTAAQAEHRRQMMPPR